MLPTVPQGPHPFTPWTSVRALCADGAVRSVRITNEPDTYFSIPARTTVRGKTITGFISVDSICERCKRAGSAHDCKRADGTYNFADPRCPDGAPAQETENVVLFTAYSYGKNGNVIARTRESSDVDSNMTIVPV